MALNWAPTDLTLSVLGTGLQLVLTTDTPAHLFMRWTLQPPLKHKEVIVKRGLPFKEDTRFCFVAYHDNEQLEPGDTILHTFQKPDWPICQTRYFYFYGTVSGLQSPSATAIFTYHRVAPPVPVTTPPIYSDTHNRTIQGNHADWDTCHDMPSGYIGPWHGSPTYYIISGATSTATFWIHRAYHRFDTSIIPAGSTIVASTLYLYIRGVYKTSGPAWPHIQITQGVQHTPVIASDYGAQLPYTIVGGQKDIWDMIINQYNQIPFTDPGLPWITPGGQTRLCLRQEMDVTDHVPFLGSNQAWWTSAQGPEAQRPYLIVSYFPP